jgi:hypothetical protein
MNSKTYYYIIILCLILSSCAGLRNVSVFHPKVKSSSEIKEIEVPIKLIEAFQEKYPGIIAEKWYKVNNNKYAASFQKDGIYKYAYFSSTGIFKDEEFDEELYYDPYEEWEWEEIPEDYF